VLTDPAGAALRQVSFTLEPQLKIKSSRGGYGELWRDLAEPPRRSRRMRERAGVPLTYYPHWVRDEVYTMKAYKYWEADMKSVCTFYGDTQAPNGMIYDCFSEPDRAELRARVFGERFNDYDEQKDLRFVHLPVEADCESLTAQGIYEGWQATGDDEWMAPQLPGLERAIEYMTTDPVRWREVHGLCKRGYTIDTWDFKFFGFDREHLQTGEQVQDAVFNVHDDTPMCIMHGDNSGMYRACLQVARMHAALGSDEKAAEYRAKAEGLRENLSKWAWNGRYYDHWVPVTPLELDQGGIDGAKVLSLSNPYAVNRGLADHDKAVGIIREYQRLRKELADTHVAGWVSVHPAWPRGFDGYEPGVYVNGGVMALVAGALAEAAFEHGLESYGVDILDRYRALWQSYADRMPSIVTPEGERCYGDPYHWSYPALMSAITAGLCGLRDESKLFNDARIAPRWVADVAGAAATLRYGASHAYLAYRFAHDEQAERIELTATGSGRRFIFHVLLPDGTAADAVTVEGETVEWEETGVEDSPYVDFTLSELLCTKISISYTLS